MLKYSHFFLLVNQSQEYYEDLFNSINGVIFPGGGADLSSSGYGKAGKLIYELAIQANKAGDYFPLWGTCLGFELLNFLSAGKKWMQHCSVEDVALALINNTNFQNSKMFRNIPEDIEHILTTEPVTVNYHNWCLTLANYSKSGLDEFYRILTLSEYKNNTFISTIESFQYPFYGVAWHPEKNQFEFVNSDHHRNIPHTANAVLISQYFANFFVNEARKNQHSFKNESSEKEALIYNYQTVYTGLHGSSFEQKYFFGTKNGAGISVISKRWGWTELIFTIWFLHEACFLNV